MRFVPIKSDDQLDMQSLHRVRQSWVGRRTSVINQIRGLLLARGITIRKGRRYAEAGLPQILENPDMNLSGPLRMLLVQLQREPRQLQSQIDEIDVGIVKASGEHEACQRLMAIPGIGLLLLPRLSPRRRFQTGSRFSRLLGLVPGQYSASTALAAAVRCSSRVHYASEEACI
jgi:transposase